jgi:hypothetical protein
MIPDDSFRQMLASGKRLEGSIGLANAKEGSFNPYRRNRQAIDPDRLECPLRCGKAVVTPEQFRIRLSIKRLNVEYPLETLQDDLKEAKEFFEDNDD